MRSKSFAICAAVKAEAYGHGFEQVLPALVEAGDQPPAEALIAEIFKRQPKLEAELIAQTGGR